MELKPERIESAAEAIYKASLCSTPWETLPKSLKSTFLEFAEAALATIPETRELTEEEHTILRVVASSIKANGDANPTAQILYSIANRLAPRSATGRPTPAPEPAAPTVELVPGMGIEECVNCGNSISVGTNNKEWVHEDSDQMGCEVAAPTGNPVAGTSVFPSEKSDADFEVPQATVTKLEYSEAPQDDAAAIEEINHLFFRRGAIDWTAILASARRGWSRDETFQAVLKEQLQGMIPRTKVDEAALNLFYEIREAWPGVDFLRELRARLAADPKPQTKQERVEELLHRHTVSRAKKVWAAKRIAAEIDAIYKEAKSE